MNYGRYQVIKEIGKGAMGVVYQAHDPNLDLVLCLKVLRQDRVSSEAFVRRFLSEAKVLGRLDHPNIVRIYNVDEDAGTVYIAMEFVEGQSLSDIMQEKQFNPEEVIEIGIAVAEALDYAHRKGVVHRDIKPGNILVRQDGIVKLSDFGIAHLEDSSAPQQTQVGEILGTPAYMSPEQVAGQPVDGRSDIFSLGIILYELCTGKRPFRGENLTAIFGAISQGTPVRVNQLNPTLPQGLSEVIMKCLRKAPAERFSSARELVMSLRALRTDKDGNKAASSFLASGKKIGIFVIAVIILIVVAAGAVYFTAGRTHETPRATAPPLTEEKVPSTSLAADSSPRGAQVFVDGEVKGTTPIKIALSEGKHEIRMSLPGHLDWEAQVQLKKGVETPLSVELTSASEMNR